MNTSSKSSTKYLMVDDPKKLFLISRLHKIEGYMQIRTYRIHICLNLMIYASIRIFVFQMAKVVSFNTNQEDTTNGNKNRVERSDHYQEYSVNILDAAKENDTSQKEKTKDHRGVISNKSLFSVSLHLQQKNQNKNPVFFSDYSRPRTRPPCHN